MTDSYKQIFNKIYYADRIMPLCLVGFAASQCLSNAMSFIEPLSSLAFGRRPSIKVFPYAARMNCFAFENVKLAAKTEDEERHEAIGL